ncbi:MAG: response regulator transcription factor [Rhodothermales bacterium]|nr:response regulator transcription factor [Rhodothermales bacterium]MBO6780894.1 response regulator transcription factor [Rhodothermales bacterium]
MADILLVEDDAELAELVLRRLEDASYRVRHAADGQSALDLVADSLPDVVLLDLMLPRVDGLEVCRRLRAAHPALYIIMLTAKSSEIDRVVGLEVGADDYVTKPFSLEELVARIRAAMRRVAVTTESGTSEKAIRIGELELDPMRREVRVGGTLVHLTVREFDLLHFLARQPDRPFTRLQLLADVWDIHYEGYDRTVDSHVQRLRAKIEEDPARPRYVRTVWGVGYKLSREDAR